MLSATGTQDAAVKRPGIQSVEQQPDEFHAVRAPVLVGLQAVKQHHLTPGSKHFCMTDFQLHGAVQHQEQHDMIVVVTFPCDFGLVAEGIGVVTEIMSTAGGVIKQLPGKGRGGEKVAFRNLMDTGFRDQHGGFTSFRRRVPA